MSWSDKEQATRIREHMNRHLAKNGAFTGLVYIALASLLIFATPCRDAFPVVNFVTLAILGLAATARYVVCRPLAGLIVSRPALWRKLFGVATIWSTATLSLYLMRVLMEFGDTWVAFVAVIMSTGVIAGGLAALSVDPVLYRTFLVFTFIPVLMAEALHPATGMKIVAGFSLIYMAYCVVIGKFVTEQYCDLIRSRLEVARNQQKLEATVETLKEANQELQEKSAQLMQSEKLASIGQLAAGVAHEINNPIGFITGNLKTMKDYAGSIEAAIGVCQGLESVKDLDDSKLRSDIEALDRDDLEFILDDLHPLLDESIDGCDRVRDIVQNMQGFARIDGDGVQQYELNDCIALALKMVRNETKARCDVVTNLDELPQMSGHPGKVNQVLVNLLINACHAMEERGTITVETAADNDNAVIRIADTGSGIPPENMARLFDPFFTTKEPGEGTGLGLYVCHGII